MNLESEDIDTRLLVEKLAVHVEHIANNLEKNQQQLNRMVISHTELNNTMIAWVERGNRNDERMINVEIAIDKHAEAIARAEISIAEQKLISKLSKFLSTSFVATLSSILSSIIVFFLLRQ